MIFIFFDKQIQFVESYDLYKSEKKHKATIEKQLEIIKSELEEIKQRYDRLEAEKEFLQRKVDILVSRESDDDFAPQTKPQSYHQVIINKGIALKGPPLQGGATSLPKRRTLCQIQHNFLMVIGM